MICPKQDQLDQIAPWLHSGLCTNRSSDCLLLGSVFPTNAICLCSTSSIPSEWWTREPFVWMSKVKSIQVGMWLELRSTSAQWTWQNHTRYLLPIWPLITLTYGKKSWSPCSESRYSKRRKPSTARQVLSQVSSTRHPAWTILMVFGMKRK